ncbi:hypothetical protein [Streptomyces broussonetiae]|uniref:hypothetical protein n=1 Tax=Streptomyces broussonetiae TaxID=2686304 RepID=UPI002D80C8E9|nr:hypothetical protein [Streptomyces broussonetiae]
MPLEILTGPAHGGRWTSLRAGSREWLWRRADPLRADVAPGDAFVDAGGLEECVPTVRGTPDHGDAWSRTWTDDGNGTQSVRCERFALTRAIRSTAGGAEADYVLTADPGYRLVRAAHGLLDLSERATLHLRAGARTRLYPDPEPCVQGSWPAPGGVRLDHLGPDDGTAVGAVVDTARCCVHDGRHRLSPTVAADGQPLSSPRGAISAAFPPPAPTAAPVWSRCSAASSTSPKPVPAMRPSYPRPARCAGG